MPGQGETHIAVVRVLYLVSFGLQAVDDADSEGNLVLYEEDALTHFAPGATGRCNVNALPCPGALSSVMVPRWASMVVRTRLNPSPLPGIWFSTAVFPR